MAADPASKIASASEPATASASGVGSVSELHLNAWIAALGRMSANHPAVARLLRIIERLQDRPYRTHVVIYGEPGTGKEGLARLIHRLMYPDGAPLERTSLTGCSADEMLKQLFGADTYRSGDGGLYGVRSGALSRAQGGSLLIDELLALPLDVQRHLNDKLGEQRPGNSSPPGASGAVTLITLTDGDAPAAVAAGRLRHDLWYRLQRLVLHVPPLRERPEDIAHTALWVANRVLRSHGLGRPAELMESAEHPAPLSPDAYRVHASAVAALRQHSWPGNFRELEAVLERAILLYSSGDELHAADVRAALADGWSLPALPTART